MHRTSRPSAAIVLALLLAPAPLAARSEACPCSEALRELTSTIERNYVGFRLEIHGQRAEQHRVTLAGFTRQAGAASTDEECVRVLQSYLRFFRDGHLFLLTRPRLSPEDSMRVAREAPRTPLREADVRRILEERAGSLDPIEGIWYDKSGYRVGIVHAPQSTSHDFVGVMLTEGAEGWEAGDVKAWFRALPDGSYDAVLYADDRTPRYPDVYLRGQQGGAAIRHGMLLHMPPVTWGREHPLREGQRGLLDPKDPRAPTLRVRDASVVVSVPSHAPEYAAQLDSLVTAHRADILAAEILVIDVRGNEGGSSWMTRALMPFLVTPGKRANPLSREGQAVVLSSPDNVAYFQQFESQGWLPATLLERMRSSPGEVVPYEEVAAAAVETAPPDSATPLPRHVAILMDGAVVSAGEAFVLRAMRNEKVVLFGAPTGGVIDYQSVTIVRLESCSDLGLLLGYPTSAASDHLPEDGINATGIPPDVPLGAGVEDPIHAIEATFGA